MAVVVDRVVVLDRPTLRRKIEITVAGVTLVGLLLEDADGLRFEMPSEPVSRASGVGKVTGSKAVR